MCNDKLQECMKESKVEWKITKYASDQEYKEGKSYETVVIDGNILLNEGINEFWTLACGSSGTKFDATNAYIGVGDSNTAEDATQTGLQAVTNKLYKAMDAGFPTYGTSQKSTWQATFLSAEANFSWQEFTVANGNSDSATNLNRKVSNQSTKVAGQIWVCNLAITLS